MIHNYIMHIAVHNVKENLRYTALWRYTSDMVDLAAAKLGRKGGKNSRKYLEPGEATALAQKAAKTRWDAYYEAHPEKLKAKLEREARKGTRKRGRPPNKRGTK